MEVLDDRIRVYWDAVREKVCMNCIDSDGGGNCRLTGDECGLKAHFARILETVKSVQSDRMAPYIDALRERVCSSCKHQSADGTCSFRSALDCGLDRYFPLVVQAIEEINVRQHTLGAI